MTEQLVTAPRRRVPPRIPRARLAAALGGFLPPPGARIGLLGGSFNPAHEAHRQISLEALRRLKLDEVWWLISPQNPLKPVSGMGPAGLRLDRAREASRHSRIRPTLLETILGSQYTADTLSALRMAFPKVHFVWLMGADNLAQVTRWQQWERIFESVPVAIFDRPSYSLVALYGKAAQRFRRFRVSESQSWNLADRDPPAWVFIHNRLNPLSATQIRTTVRKTRQSGPKKNGN